MAFPSPAPKRQVEPQQVPLKIVGGNLFGRYPKLSLEETWNMIVSDTGLVDYGGFQNVFPSPLVTNGVGRGIYNSTNGGIIIAVIGTAVFSINKNLEASFVGSLETSIGDVFIAENNNKEIAITDKKFYYVYNYSLGTFLQGAQVPVGDQFFAPFVSPGYVSFQLGRIIVVDLTNQNFWLSGSNAATQWSLTDTNNAAYVGAISLKPDTIQAAVPIPGAGNNLAVFGNTVMELFQFTGNALFPYQKQSTYNVDYGCLNASSIAALDNYIVWLSANEQGGATVMVVRGGAGREESISTDGIDFILSEISDPTNCTGFLFRQDGHLLYQFTFPTNNISLVYDFNTKLFFYVSDENQNYHPARNVVFFQNDYYFVSLNDGNLYEFGTQFTSLQYSSANIQQMYRTRICAPVRLPSQRMFIAKSLVFTVENGQPNTPIFDDGPYFLVDTNGNYLVDTEDNFLVTPQQNMVVAGEYTEAIDLSISRDGGQSFGNSVRQYMNPTGKARSRMIFQRLGQANDFTPKIKFIGYGRFVALDGILEVYE